jgi:hypothetical protein
MFLLGLDIRIQTLEIRIRSHIRQIVPNPCLRIWIRNHNIFAKLNETKHVSNVAQLLILRKPDA